MIANELKILSKEINSKMSDNPEHPEFKAAVGLSRQWDAKKAGREVANTTLEKLGADPDFFLLFSTIHYEKYGGFQEFLDGVWDVLPDETPLIGGTVAGFINNYGCYTRGATALAVSYPNMDVAIGYGKNTKRNPEKAAKECANMVRRGLETTRYKNRFLFDIIGGSRVPQLPFLGRRKVVRSRIIGNLMILGFRFSNDYLGMGMGKEEYIIKALSTYLPDYYIFGLSSSDDNKIMDNFLFYNKDLLKESVIGLGIASDLKSDICSTHGLTPFTKPLKFEYNDLFKAALKKIDGLPATQKIIELTNWSERYLDEEIHKRSFYYPIFYVRDGRRYPATMGAFFGDNVILTYHMEDCDQIELAHASGKSLLGAVSENLNHFRYNKDKIKLSLIVSCAIRINAMGDKVFLVYDMLKKFFMDTPFLVVYGSGENAHIPGEDTREYNESFNIVALIER